jgi:hypothetical protein
LRFSATHATIAQQQSKKETGLLFRSVFFALGIIAAATLTTVSTPAFAKGKTCAAMKALDPDNDGTMDLAEAKNAGTAAFGKMESDKDNTIDAKEAKGRLSKKELNAGDPDKDGTLTKDEYLNIVAKRFEAANPDKDGTVDCKELNSKSGKALLKLLK